MSHTPGPWHTCSNGNCPCGQIWGNDSPVAKVEIGKWGDEYPSIRLVGLSSDRKAEAYMEMIEYGEVPRETAKANACLIASAPTMYEVLKWLDAEMDSMDDEYGGVLFTREDFKKVREAIAKAEGKS